MMGMMMKASSTTRHVVCVFCFLIIGIFFPNVKGDNCNGIVYQGNFWRRMAARCKRPGMYITRCAECFGTECPDGYYTQVKKSINERYDDCESNACAKCYPCSAGTMGLTDSSVRGYVDPNSGMWTCGASTLETEGEETYWKRDYSINVKRNYERYAKMLPGFKWWWHRQEKISRPSYSFGYDSPCPPGSYGKEGVRDENSLDMLCLPCLPGMYTPGLVWGQTKCLGSPCPPGKCGDEASVSRDDATCSDCIPGKWWDGQESGGEICQKGSFGKPSATSWRDALCKPCPSGTYQDQEGSPSCIGIPCPPGTWGLEGMPRSLLQGNFSHGCTPCDPGWYQPQSGMDTCIEGKTCPNDAFGPTGSISKEQAICGICPGGMYVSALKTSCVGTPCALGTFYADGGCRSCPPGLYTNETGSFACLGTPCQAGYAGPVGSTSSENATCSLCPKGTYSDGTETCKRCSRGSVSTIEGAVSDAPTEARMVAGGYLPADFNTLNNTCRWCPPGTFSSDDSSSCTPCPVNTVYSDKTLQVCGTNMRICRIFPVGGENSWYCRTCSPYAHAPVVRASFGSKYTLPFPFPNNPFPVYDATSGALIPAQWPKYQDILQAIKSYPSVGFACAPCPANSYVDYVTYLCTFCPDGTHTESTLDLSTVVDVDQNSALKSPTSISIGGGTSYECISCPTGYISSQGSDCIKCPIGTVLIPDNTSTTPNSPPICACPKGSWKSSIDSSCVKCPAGTASPLLGATSESSCAICPVGTFSTDDGSDVCTPCASGSYSNSTGSSSCFQCSAGTYSDTPGASSCTSCPLGTFSKSLGASSNITCSACPAGSYSDSTGSTSCSNCSAGTYSDTPGALSAATCAICPVGTFSDTAGAGACIDCPFDTYAVSTGSQSCTQCNANMYTNTTGSDRESLCQTCAAGTMVVKTSNGVVPSFCEPCAAGSYVETPGVCTRCPSGTYSTTLAATSSTTCLSCPLGTFSTTVGANSSSFCQSCPSGSYSESIASSSCSSCGAGTFSTTLAAISGTTCLACPLGTFSTTVGANSSSFCLPCSPGKYAPNTGSPECQNSPSGTFVNTSGASTPEKCPLGTAFGGFKASSISACVPCAAGKFAPAVGMSICTICSAGTFSSQAGSFACDECPLGTFSALVGANSSLSCVPCPAGSYANSTASTSCYVCPSGTNSSSIGASSSSTCMLSPMGTYARNTGTGTAPSCWAGSFSSLEGALTCISCPAGSFSTILGATSGSSCTSCPVGSYSFGSSICSTCPNGTTLVSPSRGCVPTPTPGDARPAPSLFLSGSQEEGLGAYSEVYQREGVSFVTGPFGNAGSAISLGAGSYLSIVPSVGSDLAAELPSGNATDITLSMFVNCPPSTPPSTLIQFGSPSSHLHIEVFIPSTQTQTSGLEFSYLTGSKTQDYYSGIIEGAATTATFPRSFQIRPSPDGSKLYLLQQSAVRVVDIATGNFSTLLTNPLLTGDEMGTNAQYGYGGCLHVSADGTKIYLLSPEAAFYVIDIQTATMTLVMQTQLAFALCAFNSDESVVYLSTLSTSYGANTEIYAMDMSTKTLAPFFTLAQGAVGGISQMMLSPDGTSLVFTQQSNIVSLAIGTNVLTTILPFTGTISAMFFALDNVLLICYRWDTLKSYNFATGALIASTKMSLAGHMIENFGLSIDGSRLFVHFWTSLPGYLRPFCRFLFVANLCKDTLECPKSAGAAFCDSKWHQLALAYNSTAGTTSLSVDGVVKVTSLVTANQGRRQRRLDTLVLPDAGESKLTIGSNGVVQTHAMFTGAVSDIRMYKSILTPSDLSDLSQPKLTVIANAVNPLYHVNSTLYSWTCLAGFYGPEVFYSKINGSWIYTSNLLAPTWWPIPMGPRCPPCPAGSFASSPNSTVCTACEAGTFSSDTTGAISCGGVCPAGTFSSAGSSECIPCDVGMYSGNPGASSCSGCTDGTTTLLQGSTSATSCVPCSPGTFSTALTDHKCFSCSPGTFSTSTGTISCSPCAAGAFSNSTNPTTCASCPAGSYSANGAKKCLGCPQGTFSTSIGSTSSSTCSPCAVGTFSIQEGSSACILSPAGFYVASVGSFAPMSCLAGSSSVAGSTSCTLCPVGSYAEQSGSECTLAPPGYYTIGGAGGATSIAACPAGSSSVAGSTSCTLCQPGSFAPSPGSPQCNVTAFGTYTIAVGSMSALDCPAGSSSVAGSTSCTLCPVGSYAEQSGSECTLAPPGYYTIGGAGGATSIAACPAGSSSVAGSTSCTLCQPGSFAPLTGSRECSLSPRGFFVTATGASSVSAACPAGSSSVAGSSSCTLCQPGTYSEHDASSNCMLAPIGSFTNTSGATSVLECLPGTSSNVTGATSCPPCAPGSYSLGNSRCFPCPTGNFQANAGQGSCDLCPANTYTTTAGNIACKACPAYASFASPTSMGLSTCTCAPNAAWDTSLEVCTSKPLGQSVLIPFSFSATNLCAASNASAVLANIILSPPSGITGSLRASLASLLGYDPSAAFLDSLILCNQSYVAVNSSHPVNTETLANILPPVFLTNVSKSSSSRRRVLGNAASQYDPMIAPTNDQVIFIMGLYVQSEIADPLSSFIISVGMSSEGVSDANAANTLQAVANLYGVSEGRVSGNETTGGAAPLTTAAFLLKIAALAVAGNATPIFDVFMTDTRAALATLLSAVNLALDANNISASLLPLLSGVRTGPFTNLGFGPITILNADSTSASSSLSSSGLSAGAIVGIVIGLLIAIIIFFFARKKRNSKEPPFDAGVKANTKNRGDTVNNAPSKEDVLPMTDNPMMK